MGLLQTYWHEVSGPIKAREAQSVHFAQEPADLVCHSKAFVLAFFAVADCIVTALRCDLLILYSEISGISPLHNNYYSIF